MTGMTRSAKLHALQALRALAAAAVIVDHAILAVTRDDPAQAASHLAWTLGDAGVYCFFVISGFIMVHIARPDFGRPGAAADFLRRRVIRIVPLYWLATSAAFLFHQVARTHDGDGGWGLLARSLLFIPAKNADGHWFPVLQQGWSLNFEMLFYLVFSIALLAPRRLGLALAVAALGLFVAVGGDLGSAPLGYLASPIILWFILGMCLAECWHALGCREPRLVARVAKRLEPLGDASYSTYLSHGLFLTLLLRVWTRVFGAPGFAFVPVAVALAIVAGFAVYAVVERPLLRLAQRLALPAGSPVGKAPRPERRSQLQSG